MARNFVASSSQFINFPSIFSQLGTTYSGAIRFKADAVTGTARMLLAHKRTQTSATPIPFAFNIDANGKLNIVIRSDNAILGSNTTSATVTANQWQTAIFRRNGITIEALLDGVGADQDVTSLSTIAGPNEAFDIGAATDGVSTTRASFMDGNLAEAAIWSVTLSDAEINSYNNGMSPLLIRPSALIFYAPLYGNTIEADFSGSGNTWTNNGSTVSGFHSPTGQYKKRSIPTQASTVGLGFCVNGIVQEDGVNVARTVRVYLSSTGELLGSTVSNSSTGIYQICKIPTADEVFVVAFDDSIGDSFNAEIFDKVIPVLG